MLRYNAVITTFGIVYRVDTQPNYCEGSDAAHDSNTSGALVLKRVHEECLVTAV